MSQYQGKLCKLFSIEWGDEDLPPRMASLKGLLLSRDRSLLFLSGGAESWEWGTVDCLPGSGRPRPALSRRGRELVWLRNRSRRGRLSLQLAALPFPVCWGSDQLDTPALGTLASRRKGTRPSAPPAAPPPRLLSVLALNTSSSSCWPSARPRLFLLMVAMPLVRLVSVWSWARVTALSRVPLLSRVLGGTAGGILTPGRLGGWLEVLEW